MTTRIIILSLCSLLLLGACTKKDSKTPGLVGMGGTPPDTGYYSPVYDTVYYVGQNFAIWSPGMIYNDTACFADTLAIVRQTKDSLSMFLSYGLNGNYKLLMPLPITDTNSYAVHWEFVAEQYQFFDKDSLICKYDYINYCPGQEGEIHNWFHGKRVAKIAYLQRLFNR